MNDENALSIFPAQSDAGLEDRGKYQDSRGLVAKLIGALTRDRPYGSVSAGDRAKVAWDRLPQGQQAAFADDFLSAWLGGAAPGPLALGVVQ